MHKFTPVDYFAFIPEKFEIQTNAALHNFAPIDVGWGCLKTSALTLPDIGVVMFDSSVGKDIKMTKRTNNESTTIDTCVFLDGALESDFHGVRKGMTMEKGMQNFMYQPLVNADHYIHSQERLRIMHLTVDRQYYSSLLSDDERWMASLKESILDKRNILGLNHNTQLTPRMYAIVSEILNCPLTGSLRAIVLEAKVLEFLALQLDMMVKENDGVKSETVRNNDRDTLYALKEHLTRTFKEDHSLRGLAQQFGLNEFKLKKGFRTLFGTTVFDYLHDLKMNHAKNLLMAGENYVNEVSGLVGYKNANHFSTAFKRKFGINPNQFKN